MTKSDNNDHDREETPRSYPAEAIAETNGGYYYDDATGYELFEDHDDEGEKEAEAVSRSEERSS